MLRLLIVDDERVIRESLRDIIDWSTLDISVVGLCRNGIEAYEMILDEYPDIVLTDIKMPGLSGLELIARAREAQLDTEFVILSGYAEFDFAQDAMRLGVRHYLLKPTNPDQVAKIMQEVRKTCYARRLEKEALAAKDDRAAELRRSLFRSTLLEALSSDTSVDELIQRTSPYVDFTNADYELCSLYYVDPQSEAACVRAVTSLHERLAPGIPLHMVCVNMAVIFFFESYSAEYPVLDQACRTLHPAGQSTGIEYRRKNIAGLSALLHELLPRLRRFDTIRLFSDGRMTHVHNYARILHTTSRLLGSIAGGEEPACSEALSQFSELMAATSDAQLLRLITTDVLTRCVLLSGEADLVAELSLVESDRLQPEAMRRITAERLLMLAQAGSTQDLIKRIKHLVHQHLADTELSLKWLAENHLFMNVDYLSKQFVQKTGERFSTYLARKRVERAKNLLLCDGAHIYDVAEQVGYADNPQYFSQIFRRICGMTPTEYVRRLQSDPHAGETGPAR